MAAGTTGEKIKEYLYCVLGAALVGVGIYFFKLPNHFTIGGVSGISILLSEYFHIGSAGVIISVLNLVLLVLGILTVGKDCGVKTILGTLVLSGTLLVLERVAPLKGPLTDQPLLELCYAVLLPAIGSAILFQHEGSTGGTDIIALMLKKWTSLNIGTALLLADVLITASSLLFSVKTALFSFLGLFCRSLVVDSVIESINLCKCFNIVTSHPKEISDYIIRELHRSTTVLEAQGGYSGTHTHVILTTMRRAQAIKLRRYLRKMYPETFMMVTNSSEVIGKGFRGA